MEYSQKLKEIIKAKDITQQALANDLGVSLLSLNRWINEASFPRPSNNLKIDFVYDNIFGVDFSLDKNLKAFLERKKIILEKCKSLNISKILKRPDFIKNLNIKLTYASNRIEGSTMTESEVSDILYENLSFSHRSLLEHIEAKNHETAMLYVLDNFKQKITEDYVKRLHSILMNSIRSDAGNYRDHNVRIAGSYVPTASHLSIEKRMKEFVLSLNMLKIKNRDIFNFLSITHSKFEMIHPFSDGNGRIGRLLLMHLALQNNILPPIILPEHRKKYLTSLQKSQLENIHNDLESGIVEAVENTFKLIL